MKRNEYDVIIVGGGITGAGTARDCAMRGLKVLLIERHDIATGATGRNHGLLHSGARYAVTDQESANECIRENMILRRIASHCVDETDGFFITLPEDDLNYQAKFVESCLAAGINAEIVDPKEALRMEPAMNPDIIGAVKVPDGSVDPFRLCAANMVDAKLHGAQVLLYTEVTGVIKDGDRVVGVKTYNHQTHKSGQYYANITVNAAGIWGQRIADLAGVKIGMFPAKGALLIFAHRVNGIVINRCRKPANADILVPGDTVCIIGTTSTKIPFEECDGVRVTPEEVNLLIEEGAKLAPALASTRILRAYAGVRPLVSADNDPSGRNISRGIVCLDHETRDGVKGFVSITGGKLMTYRLMAEMATDLVCRKLSVDKACETASTPLPGSGEKSFREVAEKIWENPTTVQKAAAGRLGTGAARIQSADSLDQSLICECEEVSVGEINSAIERLDVNGLTDLRRRTRVGMGTCQGELCGCRAAGLLAKAHGCADRARADLQDFMTERWKGMYPIWAYEIRYCDHRRRPGGPHRGHQPPGGGPESRHRKRRAECDAFFLRQFRRGRTSPGTGFGPVRRGRRAHQRHRRTAAHAHGQVPARFPDPGGRDRLPGGTYRGKGTHCQFHRLPRFLLHVPRGNAGEGRHRVPDPLRAPAGDGTPPDEPKRNALREHRARAGRILGEGRFRYPHPARG